MLRPRYLHPAPRTLTDRQIRSMCELAFFQLVESLEAQRGRASARVVRRILRGIGYEDRHIDRAFAYHMTADRIFPVGGNLYTTAQ